MVTIGGDKTKANYRLFFTFSGAYLFAYSIIDATFGKLTNWQGDGIIFLTAFVLITIANLIRERDLDEEI